jgi:hypothetical protein
MAARTAARTAADTFHGEQAKIIFWILKSQYVVALQCKLLGH